MPSALLAPALATAGVASPSWGECGAGAVADGNAVGKSAAAEEDEEANSWGVDEGTVDDNDDDDDEDDEEEEDEVDDEVGLAVVVVVVVVVLVVLAVAIWTHLVE